MIEPPGQFRRVAVFEIDDGVLVAVEQPGVKKRARSMDYRLINDLPVGMDSLSVKPRKDRRGRNPVETISVITDFDLAHPNPRWIPHLEPGRLAP
jgi:hypothetical protein